MTDVLYDLMFFLFKKSDFCLIRSCTESVFSTDLLDIGRFLTDLRGFGGTRRKKRDLAKKAGFGGMARKKLDWRVKWVARLDAAV